MTQSFLTDCLNKIFQIWHSDKRQYTLCLHPSFWWPGLISISQGCWIVEMVSCTIDNIWYSLLHGSQFFHESQKQCSRSCKIWSECKSNQKIPAGLSQFLYYLKSILLLLFSLLVFFPLTLFFIYLSALNPLWNLTLKEVTLSFAQGIIKIFVFSKYVTKNLLTEIPSFCDVKVCFFSVNPVNRRLWCKMLEWKIQMCSSVVLAFSSLARIMGECLTIHSLPML